MPIDTLRFTPWHDKRRLALSQYEPLTVAVSRVLQGALSTPDNCLDVTWAQTFVRTYVHDDAKHTLQVLETETKESKLTAHEILIRRSTLQLAQRLAKIRGGLDATVLVDLVVSYGAGNASSLRMILQEACKTTPSLQESFKDDVVPAFRASLQDMQSRSTSSTRKIAYVLSQLLRCGSAIATSFVQDKDFVLTLARYYHPGLDNIANYNGGFAFQNPEATAEWQRDWLHTKTYLVDSFHAIVLTLLQGEQPSDLNHLFDLLFSMLELPSSSISVRTNHIPFISQSLLSDYQYAFDLSSALRDRFQAVDDARVDLLVSTLAELSPPPRGTKLAGGLSLLIQSAPPPRQSESATVSKEKGKAKAFNQDPEVSNMDEAITQVMDIFPSHSPQYIRRCLEHPTFDGDTERLISSLLEGTLPSELNVNKETSSESVQPVESFKYVTDRRNAWDEVIMDFSKLRIGKARNDADALLHDRSFIKQMKADIIRRVEEFSDDEEDGVDNPPERDKTIPFFEDDLEDESLTDKGVKVIGDGEASDDTDGDEETNETPSPETILELAYLENPKFFDRDGATRRSNARAELKSKTGWADEQIEGWRIMLERNPRKDKILQKHEFSGNAPLIANTNITEPSSSSTSQHGGRGRGRGGGRGANSNSAQGRAFKEKNKARSANHNRKRGHDKKIARGGAPIT